LAWTIGFRVVATIEIPSGRVEAGSSEPGAEKDAFVVLAGDGAEVQKFDTLAEAVRGSSDGDTIKICGNGPFVTDLVEINHRLTIRAADGYQPVIQSSIEQPSLAYGCLLRATDVVVLEGLEFSKFGRPPEQFASLIFTNAPMFVSNCRVHCMTRTAGIETPQNLSVKNSMVIAEEEGARLSGGIRLTQMRLVMSITAFSSVVRMSLQRNRTRLLLPPLLISLDAHSFRQTLPHCRSVSFRRFIVLRAKIVSGWTWIFVR
jgi:hypothetical protein